MTNSTSLFLHRIFKGMADSCIKVFIPILIYQSTSNLFYSLLFLLISYFLTGFLFLFLKKPIQKYPLLFLILHIVPIISICFILSLKLNIVLIILLGVLDAITTVFYWASLNFMFAFLDENVNTAKFEAGQNIGKIIFVILSAFVLDNLKNSLIFVIIFSTVLYIISVVPLCFKYNQLKEVTKNIQKSSSLEAMKHTKNFNIFHLFIGVIENFINTFLPLYLYFNNISFSLIGILVGLNYIFNICSGYLAKILCGKGHLKIVIIVNSIILFLITPIFFIHNNIVIYIATIIINFSYNMIFVSCFTMFINDQKEKGLIADSIFIRDFSQNISRTCYIGLCCISFSVFGFVFGSISSIGILFSGLKCAKDYENKSINTPKEKEL